LFGAFETLLLACLEKGLTRKTCRSDVVVRYGFWRHLFYVTSGSQSEVFLIEVSEMFFPFGGEYASAADTLQCDVKASKPRKKVDQPRLHI
jgi:hypothetical protein